VIKSMLNGTFGEHVPSHMLIALLLSLLVLQTRRNDHHPRLGRQRRRDRARAVSGGASGTLLGAVCR
jgi:hypothetical protein